jgi:hypothetical protein
MAVSETSPNGKYPIPLRFIQIAGFLGCGLPGYEIE